MPETKPSPSQSWCLGGPHSVMLGSLATFWFLGASLTRSSWRKPLGGDAFWGCWVRGHLETKNLWKVHLLSHYTHRNSPFRTVSPSNVTFPKNMIDKNTDFFFLRSQWMVPNDKCNALVVAPGSCPCLWEDSRECYICLFPKATISWKRGTLLRNWDIAKWGTQERQERKLSQRADG